MSACVSISISTIQIDFVRGIIFRTEVLGGVGLGAAKIAVEPTNLTSV